jgi:hypothetical protein
MPLNKLDNFIKNTEGRILYVNPNDLDSTDSIENEGNSLARPFKTIQRALLESARFSYVKGSTNDITEKTTILLFPGEHLVDNRPGYAIYDNGGAKAVDRSGAEAFAAAVFSLGLDSNFDLTQEDNQLYKFNSYYGGVIVPRGTSLVGLDLRKTKIRAKYVPNPTDSTVPSSSIFKITGACYFWQMSFFDADPAATVYTNPDNFGVSYSSTPTFSHHKLTCFEYADGVNNIGTYGLTDLDMYYSKLSNAYNAYREIDQKYPADPLGFAKRNPEWEIVGAFAADPINISSIISGNGSTGSAIITVTTPEAHGLNAGTPIKIRGVGGAGLTSPYNISTVVQNVLSATQFTYLLPAFSSYPTLNPSPSAASATVTVETDTVSGASPYIFNCSLRSVWGMQGMHADGAKASGFRSMVVAQFTAISIQKDDRAFVKYNQSSRTYESVDYSTVYGSELPDGASQVDSGKVYHLDPDAVYRNGWETSHIKLSNDSFIQIVSVFAIGFNKHFDSRSGGDASITNSNSNFGQISLVSSGFKKEAFTKDDSGYLTGIIAPRAIVSVEENVEWLSLNVGLTTQVGISSHLYLFGYNAKDLFPSSITQGYRIGARVDDKLYFVGLGVTYSANIYMCDNAIAVSGLTTARGTSSSVKSYRVTSGPDSNGSFTIGANALLTGETVKIISEDGDLPENITAHETYYVINNNDNNTIKLAASFTNATQGNEITVYGGTNLTILSRVSEKESGDLGSPVQYDPQNSNWYIHVNQNNDIYNAFNTGGVATYGETTDLSFVRRVSDERSLDEKIYKLRVVIPKEIPNAKDPESGFVMQESSTTGARNDADFTKVSLANTDYQFKRNPRFISTCTVSSGTVTVLTEMPHNCLVGEYVNVRNVTDTSNTTGIFNVGYNGRFQITEVTDSFTFKYSTVDVDGIAHVVPSNSTNNTNNRNSSLPRFERNDWRGNLFVYRNEVISPYIFNKQDGIYHLYALNANNSMTAEFTHLKYSQLAVDLYPQLDRDNFDDNPLPAKTFAKRSPIGAVNTNDLKRSVTRETIDLFMQEVGIGLTISSVVSTSGVATITFPRFHGLSGIVTGTITAGSNYTPTVGISTYYNVKLLNGSQTGSWNGATAKVVVSAGVVSEVEIMSPGSGYSASSLYYDQTKIGAGNGAARYVITAAGISTNIDDIVCVTGIGSTSEAYYRITSIGSSTSIAVAKTAGDPTPLRNSYVYLVGPSVGITSSVYSSATGITTFTTLSAHGLLAGNRFEVNDISNNNLGVYIVKERLNVNTFTALTGTVGIATTAGYVFRRGLDANEATSDATAENYGVRGFSFYNNNKLTLTTGIGTENTIYYRAISGVGTAQRLQLGSYIQIDNEIMRLVSTGNTTATVIRGSLGSLQESHDQNSLIRKINPLAVEFRRPSIIRASGHTFEYLGYGPGNYSTSLPQIQVKTLNDEENFLANSQERDAGVVVYTGMNNNGDFFSGNTKTSSTSGETISFDIPNPTVTGQAPNKLSAVFDEVTIKERLLVEGGASGKVLSQFDGPVNFNRDLRIKSVATFNNTVRLTQGADSTAPHNGDLIVAGGVGIGKSVNIGGTLYCSTVQFDNIRIAISSTNTIDTNSGNLSIGATSGSRVAILTNTTITGILSVSDDITAFWTSDERLKDNITPIDDPLAKVLSISGNTFDWNEKSNKSGHDVGVIAQEIEKVLPEAVVTRDNGYLAVDYHKVVPLLIEAVKELTAKVESLEYDFASLQKLLDK